MEEPQLTFRIDSARALKVLVALNVALAIAHLVTQAAAPLLHPGFVRIFNVAVEDGIPTWFSVVQLLAAAILLAVIGFTRVGKGMRALQWQVLSLIFVGMSMDEEIRLHESSEKMIGADVLGMDWIVPGMLLTGLVVVVFFHFFLSLPKTTRVLFFVAAACFIGGALGFEILMFAFEDSNPTAATLMVSTEEFLERIGISIFVFALLRYLRDEVPATEATVQLPWPIAASPLLTSPAPLSIRSEYGSGLLNEASGWPQKQ